ncbi:hypothetical protein N658DRAFT_326187 [Parathielavia hyrcaniae]|uniref:Uncharacterized protein n=1 Tax=Parathielavia hyrcaniae TaxID=113614 RepID=A0AAN6Q8T5_9PEZI|nr:hypothetical protein N658DRAFT_326187 [Parathielavia hyrcaniae]
MRCSSCLRLTLMDSRLALSVLHLEKTARNNMDSTRLDLLGRLLIRPEVWVPRGRPPGSSDVPCRRSLRSRPRRFSLQSAVCDAAETMIDLEMTTESLRRPSDSDTQKVFLCSHIINRAQSPLPSTKSSRASGLNKQTRVSHHHSDAPTRKIP